MAATQEGSRGLSILFCCRPSPFCGVFLETRKPQPSCCLGPGVLQGGPRRRGRDPARPRGGQAQAHVCGVDVWAHKGDGTVPTCPGSRRPASIESERESVSVGWAPRFCHLQPLRPVPGLADPRGPSWPPALPHVSPGSRALSPWPAGTPATEEEHGLHPRRPHLQQVGAQAFSRVLLTFMNSLSFKSCRHRATRTSMSSSRSGLFLGWSGRGPRGASCCRLSRSASTGTCGMDPQRLSFVGAPHPWAFGPSRGNTSAPPPHAISRAHRTGVSSITGLALPTCPVHIAKRDRLVPPQGQRPAVCVFRG